MKADLLTISGQDVLTTRVLIVSGQDILTNRISSILRRTGFNVMTCSESVDGIAQLDENPYDVVILDEGLPDCRLTCHIIREVFRVPVLLLGDHFQDGYWQRAGSMEIDAHVPKTIGSRELIAWMKTILRRYANVC